jgi:hypothetical protein
MEPKLAIGGGESVLQPGLVPVVMPLRPKTLGPYSQGLRKLSGAMPFARRKSFSNEIMLATVCELEVN